MQLTVTGLMSLVCIWGKMVDCHNSLLHRMTHYCSSLLGFRSIYLLSFFSQQKEEQIKGWGHSKHDTLSQDQNGRWECWISLLMLIHQHCHTRLKTRVLTVSSPSWQILVCVNSCKRSWGFRSRLKAAKCQCFLSWIVMVFIVFSNLRCLNGPV